MIYIPGTGILACEYHSHPNNPSIITDTEIPAYTDANGQISPDFNNALGMYCWAWFILTVIFTVAAMRSSWVLWFTLFFLDIELILLACGYMLDSSTTLVAANSVGFVVAFCSCKFFCFPLRLPLVFWIL
jgi:succinate-acetate transporter protein